MDVENHPGMVVLSIGGLLVAAVGLWLGGAVPRARTAAVALVPLGAVLTLVVLPRPHDIGAYPHPAPDAMHDYLDPPTAVPPDPNRTTFRVDEVISVGTEVPTSTGTSVTVTGPPQAGLPDGTAPETGQWFSTVRVPVRAEPPPGPGAAPEPCRPTPS